MYNDKQDLSWLLLSIILSITIILATMIMFSYNTVLVEEERPTVESLKEVPFETKNLPDAAPLSTVEVFMVGG